MPDLRTRLKLGDGLGGLFLVQRFAVPAVLVLQKGNARALVSLGDDGERFVVKADAAQHLGDFLDVVAVNHFHAPAEGFKPFGIDADVVAERRRLALAEAVGVHDGDEIVQFVNARDVRGLPDRAFGDFAVAEQDVGVVIQLVEPRGQRHASADAQALAERTGRHVHERQPRRGMAFEIGGEFAQRQQFARGKEAGLRPRGVEERRGVAFRQNETVVVVVVRILRVVSHVAEKQRGRQVRRRAARSGMAAARRGGGRDGMDAQLVCDALQKFNVSLNHGTRSLSGRREKPRLKLCQMR